MKLTEEDLKKHIVKEDYWTIWEKTTVCLITLDNGFEVIWHSAPIHKEDFEEDLWKKYAYENAFNKLRELYWFLAHNE